MFAEFELEIHLRDARNEPLTPAKLDEIYRNLNSCYYPSISAHELISHEWARIPHFYYNFYVYKYATSFCASRIFAQRILAGGKAEREAYLGLLRSGGSDDPLKLLRNADVDLTDAAVLESSFSGFTKDVEKLEKALHPRVIHENGQ